MNIGIVGHAADKFTPRTEKLAREIIYRLLAPHNAVLISGHCPLGGVDIWAESTHTLKAADAGQRDELN